MATSKTTPKKRTAAKSTKATTKSRMAKKTSAKQPKSFVLQQNTEPFMSFRLSMQSLYWIILGIVVIAFTAWIMKLQANIQDVYDKIDANSNATLSEPIQPKTKTAHH